jgi:uncharacterized membrane protein YfcA
MDGSVLVYFGIFLGGTFLAALITGVAGFAFALVANAVWLHVLTPLEAATLIVGYGLVVQGYAVWKLRRALNWSLLWPFLVGGALGVPIGVSILGWANAEHMRVGIGVILIVYAAYSLLRPQLPPAKSANAWADGTVGFLNGVLGGMTGLAGIIVIIWCGLRGWPKDVQRTVFQPFAVFVFLLSAAWLGMRGEVSLDTLKLFVIGLPILLLGTWAGLKLYGRLDEAGFRRVVLVLLLLSGGALIGPWLVGMFRRG